MLWVLEQQVLQPSQLLNNTSMDSWLGLFLSLFSANIVFKAAWRLCVCSKLLSSTRPSILHVFTQLSVPPSISCWLSCPDASFVDLMTLSPSFPMSVCCCWCVWSDWWLVCMSGHDGASKDGRQSEKKASEPAKTDTECVWRVGRWGWWGSA